MPLPLSRKIRRLRQAAPALRPTLGCWILLALAALPARAETIRAVLSSDLETLDPIYSASYATRTFGYLVYDTLLAQDSAGRVRPQMLESYSVSEDGLSYVFRLREGLAWHDGAPVTAADCVASIRRWERRDPTGALLARATRSLAATDARSFTLTLAQPFGLVLEALGQASGIVPFMMPERLAQTDPFAALTEADGSGPFLFRSAGWVPGSGALFRRNPAYRPRAEPADGLAGGKRVAVDGVELVGISDPATAVAALKTGEVDYVQTVSYDLLPLLARDRSVTIDEPPPLAGTVGLIRLNQANPPFDNPAIRRIAALALDRGEILAALGAPAGLADAACASYVLCGGPYAAPAAAPPPERPPPAALRRMLAEAGYRGETVAILETVNDENEGLAALVINQRLTEAGFKLDSQRVEINALFTRRTSRKLPAEGGWSAFVTGLTGLASPLQNPYVANSCSPTYPGWSCDEAIRDLLGRFAGEPDAERRRALMAEIDARAHDSVPAILWGQYRQPNAYRASLKGVLRTIDPVFWNIVKAPMQAALP